MSGFALSVRAKAVPVQSGRKLSNCQFSGEKIADSRKYVSDSCSKFIEVVRVVASLALVALHPIGLDLIFGRWFNASGQGL